MAIAAGVLLALSLPPYNLGALAFVALTPLFLSIRGLRYWPAFARGYVFAIVFSLPNMYWLHVFVARWTKSFWLGAVPWLLVCVLFSLYFGFFAAAAAKAWNRGWYWAVPLIWAGVEVFRSTIPYIFFPWSQLGATLWKMPMLLQPAWWGGIYFLSAWICLFSVIAAMFLSGEADNISPRVLWRYASAAVLILIASFASFYRPITGVPKTVAAVQPGVDLAFTSQAQQSAELNENVPKALSVGAARKRDLQVLPEGISTWAGGDKPTAPFPLSFTAPTIMGGQRTGEFGAYQSMFAYDGKWQYADKIRLVIFGEYVPFRDRLGFLRDFNLPGGDLRPGERIETLDVGGIRVGGLLCFEALFEEVARKHAAEGAELLAVMSLDDWYQNTGAIDALKAGAVLRAVENDIPLVRSASLGPSMVIDSRGQILVQAPLRAPVTVQTEVLVKPATVSPLRHVFPFVAVAVWLLLGFLPARRVENGRI